MQNLFPSLPLAHCESQSKLFHFHVPLSLYHLCRHSSNIYWRVAHCVPGTHTGNLGIGEGAKTWCLFPPLAMELKTSGRRGTHMKTS